ncbi:PAS domain-containing sensor histidine kinase [Confluentibacter citreus]|uniref:PAS domain-containing sensor histidine kinase n=1 Tax=Confluentibacter citreus TaxID=2007307 RepID=UPI000C289CF0|nr:PAS domain-containing sensor histidine kinase [Confluentibacter citreus]
MSTHKIETILKEQYVPSAEFYSQIIDSLQDYSVFTVDKELNINSWNSGATKIFKYNTEDIIGKPFETIFIKEDKDNGIPKQEIERVSNTGKSNDTRWYKRKDGTKFYADGLVFPLKNEDNILIGYVKVLRDITARKASEDAIKKYAKELEELNVHKENVLAILSHDLRSPLTGIIQGAEYLRANYDILEPTFVKELLEEFLAAVVNELNMLDYLVEWARIKYASEAFVPSKIDLSQYVKKVFEYLKDTAAIKSIKFNNNIEADTHVFADGKMIISILQNLVSNAIKFSYVSGEITLSARKREDMILIEVKDTGIGISEETQKKLFIPQVKLAKAVEENKGAGIGLLLAKGFIEKNDGIIWVESTEGKGSSFYFTLPLNKPINRTAILKNIQTVESI